MKFNTIEPNLVKGHIQLLLSNDRDDSVTAEVTISENRIMELYRNEFVRLRFIPQPHGNSPYYKPTSGYISLKEWYEEQMTPAKAWEIWNTITADEVTLIENA